MVQQKFLKWAYKILPHFLCSCIITRSQPLEYNEISSINNFISIILHTTYRKQISIQNPKYSKYVTWHEKIGLMCTNYTSSHYSIYLTFYTSYTRSVNCNEWPIVCYINTKSLALLNHKVMKLQRLKKWLSFMCT